MATAFEDNSNQDDHTHASVTTWIRGIKEEEGFEEAAEKLWNRYFTRLMQVTSRKLNAAHRRVSDEEDIVLDAFNDLFRQAREGKIPKLFDRQDLWQLLLTIADRKRINKIRKDLRVKRGGNHVIKGDSIFVTPGSNSVHGFEQFANEDPTPEFCVCMRESCNDLLDQLSEKHKRVAILKLRNHTNPEIAKEIGCSLATVERRLRDIREVWSVSNSDEVDEVEV